MQHLNSAKQISLRALSDRGFCLFNLDLFQYAF